MSTAHISGARRALAAPEVLAVIAILAILLLVVGAGHYERQARSRYSRVLADLSVQRRAIEAYAADHASVFPRFTWGCAPFDDRFEGSPVWKTLASEITTPIAYLDHLMEDSNAGDGVATRAGRLYEYDSATWISYMGAIQVPSCPVPNFPGFIYAYGNAKTSRSIRSYFGAYAVWANGPAGVSGDVSVVGNTDSHYLLYDPTNGVMSNGNIFIGQRNPTPAYVPPNTFF